MLDAVDVGEAQEESNGRHTLDINHRHAEDKLFSPERIPQGPGFTLGVSPVGRNSSIELSLL